MKKRILFLVLALISSSLAFTPGTGQAAEIAFERDSSLPIVYLNVAVKGGTVDDPAGQSGISNFVGEMLLRGTKSKTKEQIDLELDLLGAQLEVETRAEALILRGAVLSSQLEPFLKLLGELITEPSFPETEIRKLKAEVISGILEELGQDRSLANRRFTKFLFQNHAYGNSILGNSQDIQKLTRAQIIEQYERLFRDKRLLVIGAGDAAASKIESWTQSVSAARPGGVVPAALSAPRDSITRRVLIVDKPDRTQTQIHGGLIGVRMTDADFFPLYVANHAFGGGTFSARMMQELRVKRGWTYGAYSYFRHGRQPRSWQFHLFPATKDTPDALAYSIKMVEELREKGITREEFEFSKRSLINSAGFMYNTPTKRVENKLMERTLDLPEGFMKSYADRLQDVTLEQVNLAVKKYFKPERLSITVLGTAKGLVDPISKAVGIPSERIQVTPYTEE